MTRKTMWTALISSVLTLRVMLLVMNSSSGEKQIERKLERRYPIDDPQFARSMSVLLGPTFLAGNEALAPCQPCAVAAPAMASEAA